jgi:hypothetical protein
MTDAAIAEWRAISPRRYLWLDRATKLAAIGLVAIGLELGGSTPEGLAAAALGVAVGLATVPIHTNE